MPAIARPSDYNTGPSRDWKAIAAAEPTWHEEPFQMNPRALPVMLATKLRPLVTPSPVSGISLQRIPVMVRQSNQRPIEEGTGQADSMWSMSDPAQGVSGLGDEYLDNAVPADATNPNTTPMATQTLAPVTVVAPAANPTLKLLILGGLVGLAAYWLRK